VEGQRSLSIELAEVAPFHYHVPDAGMFAEWAAVAVCLADEYGESARVRDLNRFPAECD
jgi:hypothetical protein